MERTGAARALAAAALLAVIAAGCGTPSAPTDISAGPNDVVVRVEELGGFVPAEWHLTRLPTVTLYGDGRIITEGPQIEIYPGPALPNLQVRTVTPKAIQAIADAAVEAGLTEDASYDGNSTVADASTTRFVFTDDRGTHSVTAYALGMDGGAGEEGALMKLRRFREKMLTLDTWIDPAELGDETAYEPTAMRVFARPASADDEPSGDVEPGRADWPLPAGLAEGEPVEHLDEYRCIALSGADLDAVLEAAAQATQITRWQSDGVEYVVAFRPLLPDERGC